MKPVVYLLCGLGGSGKSTYAKTLTKGGLQKLSLDEEVYSRYGRAVVDRPAEVYLEYYKTAQAQLDEKLIELLQRKQSVVLDYGFWRRASRNSYKQLIEKHGGTWRLKQDSDERELVSGKTRG